MKRYSILPPAADIDVQVFAIMPPVDEDQDDPSPHCCMVHLNGSKQSFRCTCGCNVFSVIGDHRYQCNSCLETYTGE
jgi:hypothetical protein